MNRCEIISWLREDSPEKLEELWTIADAVRKDNVGDNVYLRGLIEFSNVCSRRCMYCGINAGNKDCQRYTMDKDEIVRCAQAAVESGYGTVVLQSGENRGMDFEDFADTIKAIKSQTSLAVTLSVGEWDIEVYKLWKRAGADRFLLRFETTDDGLFRRLHPDCTNGVADRYDKLKDLKDCGFEVGSGVMVGLPGQSYETLADDIIKLYELDLDMIGLGPYVAHSKTMLFENSSRFNLDENEQTLATDVMTYKVLALTRICCRQTNIPATTALAALNVEQGYENGLRRGCNVVMPNITPVKYRKFYDLYPGKVCTGASEFELEIKQRIEKIGRVASSARGDCCKNTKH